MAEIDYVKKDIEPDFASIPEGYAQKWAHRFSVNSVAEIAVVKLRDLGAQRDGKGYSLADQKIAEFLFTVGFATEKQISKYLDLDNGNKFDYHKRLRYLTASHIINSFTLHSMDNGKGEFDDALEVYTLDFGGKYLMEHYSDNKFSGIMSWFSSNVMCSSRLVAKSLIQTEFYLKLLETIKENDKAEVLNYKALPEFIDHNRKKTTVNAQFELPNLILRDGTDGFLVDVVYPGEEVTDFRDRIGVLDDIIHGKAKLWQRTFDQSSKAPTLIVILSKVQEQAGYIIKTLANSTAFSGVKSALPEILFLPVQALNDGLLSDENKFITATWQVDGTTGKLQPNSAYINDLPYFG